MDSLRSCHTTLMYLWGRDRPPVPVRWFFAEPDAEVFPYAHSFWNVDWEMDKGYKGGNDLIGDRGAYANGSTFVHYPGKEFHGPPQAYIDGGRWGIDPPLVTGPDGAIPECRVPADSPAGWIVGDGGQGQGGESHACGILGYGMTGGQGQGGTATMCSGYWIHGTGGEAQGGSAIFSNAYRLTGSGGQAEGGTAPQYPGMAVVGSGGQAEGGTAYFGEAYYLHGSGGQAEGGAAVQLPGMSVLGSGGQAEGGEADQYPGEHIIADGGQAEGGVAEQGGGCGEDALFVDGWVWEGEDPGGYFEIPAGAEDGDLLLLIVVAEPDPATTAVPLPWLLVGSVHDVTAQLVITVHYQYKDGSTPASGIIITGGDTAVVSAVVAVRNADVPYLGTAGVTGDGNALAPSVDVENDCSLLLAAFGSAEPNVPPSDPSDDMIDAVSPENGACAVYYNPEVSAGASGDRHATLPGAAQIGVQIICPPG